MDFKDLPRGLPRTPATSGHAPRALWMDPATITDHEFWRYKPGKIFLGTSQGEPIGIEDNRHLLTIAGSRAGKGTSAILPNLLLYPGSVMVIDPKGENATKSAERRGLGRGIEAGGMNHDVHVIDPFGAADVDEAYLSGFNPFSDLDPYHDEFVDECDAIADALVVQDGKGDNAYFYDAARLILRGYIAWVAAHPDIADKSLNEVQRLIFLPRTVESSSPEDKDDASDDDIIIPDVNDPMLTFDHLNTLMRLDPDFADGVPFQAASMLGSLDAREFANIMSTIQNQIGFISSPPMARILSGGSRSPNLRAWKHGQQSVYLCLPAGRMHRHFRFFRLFINRLMSAIEADPNVPDIPALMILDEMHVLGHMKSLETAAGLIAGFGTRIWSIWQDLAQLKSIYGERWETFLGNASVFQTFGLNDLTSLKYISERLGTSSVLQVSVGEQNIGQAARGFSAESQSIQGAPLLTPDEVAEFFSRQSGNQLIIYPGTSPIFLNRLPYHTSFFAKMRENHD